MVAPAKIIPVIVALIIAVGAAYAIMPYISGGTPAQTSTTTGGSYTQPTQPFTSSTTSTTQPQSTTAPSTTTTTGTEPVPTSNAWAEVETEGDLRLTSEPPADYPKPPVYVNSSFMDFYYIKARFNLTVGNVSSNFTITWRISRGPYTATCYNYFDDNYVTREVSNALILNTQYVFDDGYWFNITVFMPNSTMIWAFNKIPIIGFDTDATPHGAQRDILGAIVKSSDPNNNGWWSSAEPLMPPLEAAKCRPVVEGSPEVDSLGRHLELWLNLQIPSFLEPFEALEALTFLGQENEDHFIASNDYLYHEGTVKMTYLGLMKYPGTGVRMHIYNVTMLTDTGNVQAWMVVAAESIMPLEYHVRYPNGEALQGTPVSIDFEVLDAELGPPLPPE